MFDEFKEEFSNVFETDSHEFKTDRWDNIHVYQKGTGGRISAQSVEAILLLEILKALKTPDLLKGGE